MGTIDVAGLYQKFGLEQVVPMAGGEPHSYGDVREVILKIDLTELGSSAAIITGTDNINFPAGYRLEEVEVATDTAVTSAGSTATLNIGLIRTDRTTAIEADGILKVAPQADFNTAGEVKTYRVGVTGIGDLVGVTSGSNPGYFTAHYGTEAFTAGEIVVRVRFRKV